MDEEIVRLEREVLKDPSNHKAIEELGRYCRRIGWTHEGKSLEEWVEFAEQFQMEMAKTAWQILDHLGAKCYLAVSERLHSCPLDQTSPLLLWIEKTQNVFFVDALISAFFLVLNQHEEEIRNSGFDSPHWAYRQAVRVAQVISSFGSEAVERLYRRLAFEDSIAQGCFALGCREQGSMVLSKLCEVLDKQGLEGGDVERAGLLFEHVVPAISAIGPEAESAVPLILRVIRERLESQQFVYDSLIEALSSLGYRDRRFYREIASNTQLFESTRGEALEALGLCEDFQSEDKELFLHYLEENLDLFHSALVGVVRAGTKLKDCYDALYSLYEQSEWTLDVPGVLAAVDPTRAFKLMLSPRSPLKFSDVLIELCDFGLEGAETDWVLLALNHLRENPSVKTEAFDLNEILDHWDIPSPVPTSAYELLSFCLASEALSEANRQKILSSLRSDGFRGS